MAIITYLKLLQLKSYNAFISHLCKVYANVDEDLSALAFICEIELSEFFLRQIIPLAFQFAKLTYCIVKDEDDVNDFENNEKSILLREMISGKGLLSEHF